MQIIFTKKIGNYLLNKKYISEEEYPIYQYGLDILFSSLLTSLSIIVLACLIDNILWGIIYLAVTIPLRMFAGGYHANTYNRCFIVSNTVYLIMSLITRMLQSLYISSYCRLFILLLSETIIFLYAPIPNSHHPISSLKMVKNKIRCRITLIVDFIIITILLNIHFLLHYACISISSILMVALLVIIAKAQKRKEDHTYE